MNPTKGRVVHSQWNQSIHTGFMSHLTSQHPTHTFTCVNNYSHMQLLIACYIFILRDCSCVLQHLDDAGLWPWCKRAIISTFF